MTGMQPQDKHCLCKAADVLLFISKMSFCILHNFVCSASCYHVLEVSLSELRLFDKR